MYAAFMTTPSWQIIRSARERRTKKTRGPTKYKRLLVSASLSPLVCRLYRLPGRSQWSAPAVRPIIGHMTGSRHTNGLLAVISLTVIGYLLFTLPPKVLEHYETAAKLGT